MVGKVGIHKKGEISLESILEEIRRNPSLEMAGAIACFVGIVRGYSPDGSRVEELQYEAYEEEAILAMDRIQSEICHREGILDVHIHHIVDSLKVGEEILYVVVAGRSRGDVFPALSEVVERLKGEVPIFKKEILSSGSSYWVSEVAYQGKSHQTKI
ncbi:MAG: molybdenum cofactor biosynthesis protein MoaE [Candidatus Bathyarchaeia archaeon]